MAKSKISFKYLQSGFFFGALFLTFLGFFGLFRPFLFPIFWAATIAVIFYPYYKKINHSLKHDSISSSIMILLIFALVFLPIIAIILMTVNQSVYLYNSVDTSNLVETIGGNVSSQIEQSSLLSAYLSEASQNWSQYLGNATKSISIALYESFIQFTQFSIRFIFMLFIFTYSLFYFFKDGEKILNKVMFLSPLGDKYEKTLFERFTSTARATIKGTFIIGAVQGTLGGILFAITGIPGAFVWGVVMTALSIIPAIGSFLIWVPAGLIMLFLGNIWEAITIFLVGSLLIGTIDNLLRPKLVGKDIQMHPLIVLFSTLGGIAIFGVSGFVIGPMIAAIFLSLLSIYELYYKTELKKN